jgi:plastocyanin
MSTSIARLKLGILAGILFAYGCGSSSGGDVTDPPAGGKTVNATADLSFTPATVTIAVGQAVTFAFGSVPHNVFFDAQAGAPADIGGTNAGVSIDRTFPTAGSYPYTCHIHPSMHGTVVVQ